MPMKSAGIVWVVSRVETSARDYGPIKRIFVNQRNAEAYAKELRDVMPSYCDDIVIDCSAFTLYE